MVTLQPSYKRFGENMLTALSQWKCLFLTILIDVCIISVCWCQWTASSTRRGDYFHLPICHYDYLYIPSAFLILFYFIYLIECWKCQIRLEISYPIDVQSAYTYFTQLKSLNPDLYWQVSCFHYSRSTNSHIGCQTVNHFLQPHNGSMYEKVVTETDCGRCNMQNLLFVDDTPLVHNLENFLLVKLQVRKKVIFQSESIEEFYNKERKLFLQPFQFKDDYLEVKEGLSLYNNCKCSTILITNDRNRQPLLISNKMYIICSLLLLSWPLRLFIICKTAHLSFDCIKIVSARVNQSDNESLYSIENFEKFPPSYSQALKLCESGDVQTSLIFCNQDLVTYQKYESISSKDSLYSLELDFKLAQQRNRNPYRSNSFSNCINNIIVSARKVAGIYFCNKPIMGRSKTISLNIIASKNANIKRDFSLPTNLQSAPT